MMTPRILAQCIITAIRLCQICGPLLVLPQKLGGTMPKTSFAATVILTAAVVASSLLATMGGPARAAEVKVLAALALQSSLKELLPEFEKSSGHKVTIAYGPAGALVGRVQKGEDVDVAIVLGAQVDNLMKEGKLAAGSRTDVAKVGISAFVRKGAAKPDISSLDAFKRAVAAAKLIAYVDPATGGASGIYMARLFDRLGLAAELTPKTKLTPPPPAAFAAVANGDAELGFNQTSEILAAQGVDLVGPLPAEIQNYSVFAAGIAATSGQADAAKAFIGFLSSPPAAAAMKAKGFE
jgi:molybdate transport system substrate-binding protein